MNIRDWFQKPVSTLTEVAAYNPQTITCGLMGAEPIMPLPPPQDLYDLDSYRTPFALVWRRPANVLQG